jgi:Domain of Unknown Function (DUF928)
MNNSTKMYKKTTCTLLTLIMGWTMLIPITSATAVDSLQSTNPNSIIGQKGKNPLRVARLRINIPGGLGAPGRRSPGASRGKKVCLTPVPSPNDKISKLSLTALVPKSNLSLTTLSDPTLYFYLPEINAPQLRLVVSEFSNDSSEDDKIVYEQTYKPNGKIGIAGFKLPANTLKPGKEYGWFFEVVCSLDNNSDNQMSRSVEGNITRVNDTQLVSKLQRTTPGQRLNILAEAGIWQDTIDILAQMRLGKPTDISLKSDWESILAAPGIEFDKRLWQAAVISPSQTPQPIKK